MTSESRQKNWRDRIAQLSATQQRLLIERLRKAGLSPSSKGGRLVAFYQSDDVIEPDALRDLCAQQLPAHMVPQRFIRQDALALTPTGKLDRRGMRARLWLDEPATTGPQELTAARTDIERELCDIWCDVLGIDEISVYDNFFEVGGDSLQIIRIISRASKAGLSIQPDAIFTYPTIAELAQVIDPGKAKETRTMAASGDIPLLPIQRWFFDVIGPSVNHWNQSLLFRLNRAVESSRIKAAIDRLLAHHDGLRARFFQEQGRWKSAIAEQMSAVLRTHDLGSESHERKFERMKVAADRENAAMDLQRGPLFRALFFTEKNGHGYVALIAHHLVVDALSWQVLIGDLNQLLADDASAQLYPTGTPLRLWATELEQLAARQDVRAAARYWRELAQQASVNLPGADSGAPENTEGSGAMYTGTLDAAYTEALRTSLPGELRATVQELLLSALLRTLVPWCGRPDITFDMEGHGRESLIEDLDLSRTVGWCTTVFPVRFVAGDIRAWDSPREALRLVKQQFRELPHSGLSHGVLMYSGDTAVSDPLNAAPRSQLLFNYLGRDASIGGANSVLDLVDARFAQARDPVNRRAYALELNAVIRADELAVDWAYCPHMHSEQQIRQLSDQFLAFLIELVDGEADAASTVTPSDFPMAGLDQSALDNLSSQLDELDDD